MILSTYIRLGFLRRHLDAVVEEKLLLHSRVGSEDETKIKGEASTKESIEYLFAERFFYRILPFLLSFSILEPATSVEIKVEIRLDVILFYVPATPSICNQVV